MRSGRLPRRVEIAEIAQQRATAWDAREVNAESIQAVVGHVATLPGFSTTQGRISSAAGLAGAEIARDIERPLSRFLQSTM